MKLPKTLKKLYKFCLDNYFILVFLACIGFVGLVSFYKLFISKPTFVYVRIKVGQGLWWTSTQKPSLWFVKNIKKGDVQTDLLGKPIAEVLSVRYYPWWQSNQYDVYLNMKLKVSGNKKTGKYNFNRSTIGVGAPVDFEFPTSQFSGTIIDMTSLPIKDKYIEKTVYLTKPYAYTWEYDGIKIGDRFYDGEKIAIEIVDKTGSDDITINPTFRNTINPLYSLIRKDVFVKIKIAVKEVDHKFIFEDDQVIALGKSANFSTDNFLFVDYIIAGVE